MALGKKIDRVGPEHLGRLLVNYFGKRVVPMRLCADAFNGYVVPPGTIYETFDLTLTGWHLWLPDEPEEER